tara:strand:- start:4439 stop:4864 length:426 start_codon:yes stop_codon:yes gene_type:complete
MPVVGVNLTNIDATKHPVKKAGKININNNFSITEAEEREFAGDKTRKTLRLGFAFTCAYNPELGNINLKGNVLIVDKMDEVTKLKTQWEKEKTLPVDLMRQVSNAALHKCNVQAIKISEDISLPPPIYLPRVRSAEEKQAK